MKVRCAIQYVSVSVCVCLALFFLFDFVVSIFVFTQVVVLSFCFDCFSKIDLNHVVCIPLVNELTHIVWAIVWNMHKTLKWHKCARNTSTMAVIRFLLHKSYTICNLIKMRSVFIIQTMSHHSRWFIRNCFFSIFDVFSSKRRKIVELFVIWNEDWKGEWFRFFLARFYSCLLHFSFSLRTPQTFPPS